MPLSLLYVIKAHIIVNILVLLTYNDNIIIFIKSCSIVNIDKYIQIKIYLEASVIQRMCKVSENKKFENHQ